MADRIAIMYGGIVQQNGTPADVYDRPANLYVAGFIGSPARRASEPFFAASERVCIPDSRTWRLRAGQSPLDESYEPGQGPRTQVPTKARSVLRCALEAQGGRESALGE